MVDKGLTLREMVGVSEDIVVDRDREEYSSMFDHMYFFDLKMGCETRDRIIALDYSYMYDGIVRFKIPKDLEPEYFPENFMVWNLGMSRRMTVVDYITELCFLHEDLHIVVYHLLKDEITQEKMNFVQNNIVDSTECFVFLFSLIGHLETDEEMWERTSEIYEALHINRETGGLWIPPDMRMWE